LFGCRTGLYISEEGNSLTPAGNEKPGHPAHRLFTSQTSLFWGNKTQLFTSANTKAGHLMNIKELHPPSISTKNGPAHTYFQYFVQIFPYRIGLSMQSKALEGGNVGLCHFLVGR